MRKLFLLFIMGVSLLGCGLGTRSLKDFDKRVFPVSTQTLAKAIDSLLREHPAYNTPEKWDEIYNWKEETDFAHSSFFYLQTRPEEMYYIGFIGKQKDSVKNSKSATIAINMVYDGSAWQKGNTISPSEKSRVEKRFDDEIIAKLEQYTQSKAVRQP